MCSPVVETCHLDPLLGGFFLDDIMDSTNIHDLKTKILSEVIWPMEQIKLAEKALKDEAASNGIDYALLKKVVVAEASAKEGELRRQVEVLDDYLGRSEVG